MHYPHLASIAAGFFKAHYHQEPDPTNSLLNICGYGGLVRFKKENPAQWLGLGWILTPTYLQTPQPRIPKGTRLAPVSRL